MLADAFDRLQMRRALMDEATWAAGRLQDAGKTWSVDENAGTVRDLSDGGLIVYLDPLVTTMRWRRLEMAAREGAFLGVL